MRARALLVPLFVLSLPAATRGQDLGWSGSADFQATLWFGAFGQSVISTRAGLSHADSTWEYGFDGSHLWGKLQRSNGDWELFYRSWRTVWTADYRPFDRFSPFLLANMESAFQRRIDLRWSLGAGAKWAIVRHGRNRFDLSAALLAEQTDFNNDVAVMDPGSTDLLARWSFRVRGRRTLADERVTLESVTFYKPEGRDMGRYVVTTSNSAAFHLNESLSLKSTFDDTYDSRAEARGARSNHEGKVLFGVSASF